jgi:5-methylthioadenosine/S-adenosylhomocysteine deaminase
MNYPGDRAVDLVIEARWMVPVDPPASFSRTMRWWSITAGSSTSCRRASLAGRFSPLSRKCLDQHVLIPGLVNLHTHAAMTLLRGLADDLPLMQWLHNHVWPAEAQHVSAQFVHDGTLLACAEMLRGGITCFNDMYFFPKAAADAVLASGIRAAIGLITVDFPSNYASRRGRLSCQGPGGSRPAAG